jgi:hypothetical protein
MREWVVASERREGRGDGQERGRTQAAMATILVMENNMDAIVSFQILSFISVLWLSLEKKARKG